MTIELVIGRMWKIRVDGMRPDREFGVGEETQEGGDHAETYYKTEFAGCQFTPSLADPARDGEVLKLEWVAFDSQNEDWVVDIDRVKLGPVEMWVKFKGDDPIYFTRLQFWYKDENDQGFDLGVKLDNGEWVELDDNDIYIRAEVE